MAGVTKGVWVEGALAVDWVMAGMSLEGDEEKLLLARVVAGTMAVRAEEETDSGAAATATGENK